jgi:hypothetical protein
MKSTLEILAAAQFLEKREVREHQQFGYLNQQSLRICLERMKLHNLYKPNLAGNKSRSQ